MPCILAGRVCERCSRGYYCGGGQVQSATRIACSVGQTTLEKGSVAWLKEIQEQLPPHLISSRLISSHLISPLSLSPLIVMRDLAIFGILLSCVVVTCSKVSVDACICDKGFRLDAATSSCLACPIGSFKTEPGNIEECTQCPEGYKTYQTGSVSNSSCIEDIPPGTSNSTEVQDQASVPSVSFNFSMSGLAAADDPEKLRQQLIAPRTHKILFGVTSSCRFFLFSHSIESASPVFFARAQLFFGLGTRAVERTSMSRVALRNLAALPMPRGSQRFLHPRWLPSEKSQERTYCRPYAYSRSTSFFILSCLKTTATSSKWYVLTRCVCTSRKNAHEHLRCPKLFARHCCKRKRHGKAPLRLSTQAGCGLHESSSEFLLDIFSASASQCISKRFKEYIVGISARTQF